MAEPGSELDTLEIEYERIRVESRFHNDDPTFDQAASIKVMLRLALKLLFYIARRL